MGYSSVDDIVNQITTNGKYDTRVCNKTTTVAGVAGTWTDTQYMTGFPFSDSTATNNYAGTSLTYVPTTESTTGAIPHGGDVSTATKHFLNVSAGVFAAAGAPWFLMCVDQLGYVRIQGASSADVTGTGSRTVTMTALNSGARYPYGEGSRLYVSSLVAPGAGGPNISALTYTNSNSTPVTGRVMPNTVSCAAAPVAGNIIHTGNAANRTSPFLPLVAGDTGVADIEAFTLSGGVAYTGASSVLVMHHVVPLFVMGIPANGILAQQDFLNMSPSLPRIRDGAFLKFLLFQTGATTTTSPIFIQFDYGWGG